MSGGIRCASCHWQLTYDAANRLTSFTGPSLTDTFAYNGLGDRLQQTVNGQTTDYTLDLNAGLTQVLHDGPDSYYYGFDRIAQAQGGQYDYFLGDALGSVRQLTGGGGAITLAEYYDPYGNIVGSAGTGSTMHGYTGEIGDRSGLTYLQARYYDTDLGRFITKDIPYGSVSPVTSVNPYPYAYDNPVNYVDPTGWSPLPPMDTGTSPTRYTNLVQIG